MTLIDVPMQAQSCSAPVVSIVWGYPGTPIETLVPFQDLLANFRRTPWRDPPGAARANAVITTWANRLRKEDASSSSPPVTEGLPFSCDDELQGLSGEETGRLRREKDLARGRNFSQKARMRPLRSPSQGPSFPGLRTPRGVQNDGPAGGPWRAEGTGRS